VIENLRSILRGEISGSVKLVALSLIALLLWFTVWTLHGINTDSENSLTSQQGRFRTLLLLGDEYKRLSPTQRRSTDNVDVATVFAQVSETLSLGSRVNRITPDGRNQSVEINRLYAEELADMQRQLMSRGVKFIAAEIRALPAGKERLFTISAIIGPSNS